MAESFAIEARGISKTFRIHAHRAATLKERVLRGFGGQGELVEHHALRNISFTLGRGRSLAIVGGNGSGKSTLLKILTGITSPDAGTFAMRGRVAALLEVTAGFSADLTGMENIFLQGSILGLSRAGIMDRLDKVLEFSELGRFIHTPMRCYSSGMVMRLGFALAVYSDAEILLVDEVLAVGDAAFQAKCLQKIADLRRHGRTIVLVSHSLEHVETFADDLLWLEHGEVQSFGTIEETLARYVVALSGYDAAQTPRAELDPGAEEQVRRISAATSTMRLKSNAAEIGAVRLLRNDGTESHLFHPGEPLVVEVEVTVREAIPEFEVQLAYSGREGVRMGYQSTEFNGHPIRNLAPGRHVFTARAESTVFQPGRYLLTVALADPTKRFTFFDARLRAHSFQVRGDLATESGALVVAPGAFRVLSPEC